MLPRTVGGATPPPDNHVHSEFSWDTPAAATMEASCRRAIALGLPGVAFTEHVDFVRWGLDDTPPPDLPEITGRPRVVPLDVEGYHESLARCRELFPQLRIRSGVEAGEPHFFAGSLAAVLRSGAFERILGSLHSVVENGRLVGADRLFGAYPNDVAMRRYFAGLLDLVTSGAPFEVLAHCDFPRRYWPVPPGRPGGYVEADYEEEYRTVFRALAASGRALEINTRSPLWSVTLVRWWHDAGGGAVSFGSDAHQPFRVGEHFDLAVDVVEAAGFRPPGDPHDFWRR